jgi:hypothetical protein
MNQYIILSFTLVGLNLLTFAALIFVIVSSQRMVDRMTNKLMSRDINEYAVASIKRDTTKAPNAVVQQETQNIAEADPNDILHALAVETGRLDELERI